MSADGEGFSSDPGEELVAKVIPLRRRGESPRVLADEPRPPSNAPEDEPARGERSVWDPPPGELRRRTPRAGGPSRAGRRVLARRTPGGLLGAGAAAAATIIAAALLALGLGGLQGQSGSAPGRGDASASRAAHPAHGATAQVIRHSTSSQHATLPRSRGARTRTAAGAETSSRTRGLTATSPTSASASVGDHPQTQPPSASVSPPPQEARSTPVANDGAATAHAQSASATHEFGFEQ